jgi:hypothetical protein
MRWSVYVLPALRDVDVPADLEYLWKFTDPSSSSFSEWLDDLQQQVNRIKSKNSI